MLSDISSICLQPPTVRFVQLLLRYDNRRRTLKISMAQGWNYTDMEHTITLRQFLQSPVFLPLSVETGKEKMTEQGRILQYTTFGLRRLHLQVLTTQLLPKQTTQTQLLHYKSNSGSAELRYMISNTTPCSGIPERPAAPIFWMKERHLITCVKTCRPSGKEPVLRSTDWCSASSSWLSSLLALYMDNM